ncbi:hypothetical protein R3P38DRAFT_3175011 [Favolaschia claudopus]|uniref:Uncharacterized protein n=1 Tax=Favolaschia claudopus TaxID=2862362 RepID=A0AAW0DC74_9AGAR
MSSNERYVGPQRSMSPRVIIARLYAVNSRPRSIIVHTMSSNCSFLHRFPVVESHMTPLDHTHGLHRTYVRVTHRDQHDRVKTSYFRCYFRCCSNLPSNRTLGIRGEVVIVRMSHQDFFRVADVCLSDRRLADHVATVLAPKLHEFQVNRTRVASFGTIFPGTF